MERKGFQSCSRVDFAFLKTVPLSCAKTLTELLVPDRVTPTPKSVGCGHAPSFHLSFARGPLPVDEWTITSTRTASTVEKNPLRPIPNRETNGPPFSTCYSRCIIRAEIQGPLSLLLRPTSKLGCALGSRVRRSPFLLRRQETPIDRSFGGFY
ncbi:hypothetical protein B296_00015370 [Ensete ventricosum]|uniref:Uncharacterized protein n=1 Tax=Ensete ventricosum TaxID=4639 RepID=A0A426ZV49_ENSVE|nr:hypothetical protein B296_00015370 [Ensete ventricosum]